MIFSRWGAFVYRFRKPIALLAVVIAVAAASVGAKVTDSLTSGGWTDPHSESAAVAARLADEFGAGKGSIVALFEGDGSTDARSAAFQDQVATSLRRLAGDPIADSVIGFAQTGDARFISADGHASYAVVRLTVTDDQSVNEMPRIRALIDKPAGIELRLTGVGPFTEDQARQSEKELVQAEAVSGPFALLILLAVFASLIAAGLPLLVAALAIPTTLGGVYLVAQTTELSIYVQNVATMLGLALAIDYSLFMVSRFREELRRGRTVGEAVEVTVATSGKAVAFSGLAVAIGLSGLLLFTPAALRSFGIGGSIVVASSVFYALTFLPAVLGMLGPRVNALSLGGLSARVGRRIGRGSGPADGAAPAGSRWARVAHEVMARPVAVLVPAVAFLLLTGTPFLQLSQGVPNASTLPAGLESREASVALADKFQKGETSPLEILATVEGDALSAANITRLVDYAAKLDAIDGIDRVEGPFAISDPATGQAMTPTTLAAFYAAPADQLPPQLAGARDQLKDAYVRGSTVRLDAISPLDPVSPAGGAVVPAVRAVHADGVTAQVGGLAAEGHDFMVSQSNTIPYAVTITLVASGLILFLLFGSVVIPLKAVVMTLLSITASFGALVWIFQEGNLSGVLGFFSPGFTVAGTPIIMFSVLFGLSMDYEVLLLSRIQEAYRRTGDNTASVAEGLARTAGVITGAALIMVTVFSAFALAESITIKSIGVGMAIAVLIDATIIRVLLVPAAMRLMGRWNWWAPGPLGRLADRLGFSHVEDEDEPAPGSGAGSATNADGTERRPAAGLAGS